MGGREAAKQDRHEVPRAQRVPGGGREGRRRGARRHPRGGRRRSRAVRREVRGRASHAKTLPRDGQGTRRRRGGRLAGSQAGGEGRLCARDAFLEGVLAQALDDEDAEGWYGGRVLLADGSRGRVRAGRHRAARLDERDDRRRIPSCSTPSSSPVPRKSTAWAASRQSASWRSARRP